MLRARQVFQAKYGHGDAMVGLFQEFNTRMQEEGGDAPHFRILTDATGPFFTVITESGVNSTSRLTLRTLKGPGRTPALRGFRERCG